MRIFLTGSTGFIGSRIVPELISAGHQVLGLTRSTAGADALTAAGAQPHRGDLVDLDSLRLGAAGCDAVIHTAFDHDFSNFVANCQKDARAIEALGSALQGTHRPLLITSGTGMGAAHAGELATEDHFNPQHPNPRAASEIAGEALLTRGIKVCVVRLSQIHDTVKQGLVTEYIRVARSTGVAAYVGSGANCWSAAHVTDTARLYRLVCEQGEAGQRFHATAEQALAFRDIAEAVGRRVGVPVRSISAEQAAAHFGWFAAFVGSDMSASSALTQQRLDWRPSGVGLLEDLANLNSGADAG